jgi:hypothetical protein
MSMAVWALDPDGNYIFAGEEMPMPNAWLLPNKIFCWRNFIEPAPPLQLPHLRLF